MTYEEYARLSYDQKLHFPAAEYQRIVEEEDRQHRSKMARLEKYNSWIRYAILSLWGAVVLILLGMVKDTIWPTQ